MCLLALKIACYTWADHLRLLSSFLPSSGPAFRGYHTYSFANQVMGKRLPTILAKGIDDTHVTLNQESDEDRIVDLVDCVHRMEDLMADLQSNAKLRPIIDDCTFHSLSFFFLISTELAL